MIKKGIQYKAIDFQEYLERQLKDPVTRKNYDEYGRQLAIAYQILQLRKKKRISQSELAKKIRNKSSFAL